MDEYRRHPEPPAVNGHPESVAIQENGVPSDFRGPGQPHETTIGTNQDLTDQIRRLRAVARHKGERIPGRPALAAATGTTQHQVRKVLDEIAREQAASHQAAPAHTSTGDNPLGTPSEHSPTSTLVDDQPTEPTPTGTSQVHHGAETRRHRRPPSWPLVIIGRRLPDQARK